MESAVNARLWCARVIPSRRQMRSSSPAAVRTGATPGDLQPLTNTYVPRTEARGTPLSRHAAVLPCSCAAMQPCCHTTVAMQLCCHAAVVMQLCCHDTMLPCSSVPCVSCHAAALRRLRQAAGLLLDWRACGQTWLSSLSRADPVGTVQAELLCWLLQVVLGNRDPRTGPGFSSAVFMRCCG